MAVNTPTVRRNQTDLFTRIVFWFAFLGPIGNLIPVPGLPSSLRFFHLMLVPGIILFLIKGIRLRAVRDLLILTPVLLYMMSSATCAFLRFSGSEEALEGNPLIRFALFLCLLLFTLCAGDITRAFNLHQRLSVIASFMRGYFVSLIVGYIFFIGFYTHVISLAFISHFEVLVQWGFGLLRFSPGSYPNEYGIVSSFALSVLTLLLLYRRELLDKDPVFRHIRFLPLLLSCFLLTLGALFLATTRAAYVAYMLSILYIGLSQGGFKKPLMFLGKSLAAGSLLLVCVEPFFDVAGILVNGYNAFFDQRDFGNGRINAWRVALDFFLQQPYWGVGFGFTDMMHNVYLQLLFGLGIFGSCLLLLTVLLITLRARGLRLSSAPSPSDTSLLFIQRVSNVALIHVLWFAMGNHNLNHFLTWFAVLLVYLRGGSPVESETFWVFRRGSSDPLVPRLPLEAQRTLPHAS